MAPSQSTGQSGEKRIPVIGLTTYGLHQDGRYFLPGSYVEAVRRAGGLPIMLPPGEAHWRAVVDKLDGLVLTGGGDIAPRLYGGADHDSIYNVDDERDSSELNLARHVLERELPTLAICRGMQIVNVAAGGTLLPHVPDVFGDRVSHRVPPRNPVSHAVELRPGSMLAQVLNASRFDCMSLHHQAVDRIAPFFEACGHAPDACIEAIESRSFPWVWAVQWHPELSAAEDPRQQRLFDVLKERALQPRAG